MPVDEIKRMGCELRVLAELLGAPQAGDICPEATDEELREARGRVYGDQVLHMVQAKFKLPLAPRPLFRNVGSFMRKGELRWRTSISLADSS